MGVELVAVLELASAISPRLLVVETVQGAGATLPGASGLSMRTSSHCCVVPSAKWTSAGVVS
jgi:hypothetical protein